MSYEKFKKTIYFFNNFNSDINEKIAKKMSNVLYVIFVDYSDFYDPNAIKKKYYFYQNKPTGIFNKSVDLFPHHIKSIIFNDKFNQPVNNLPTKLKELVFGNEFNQLVDNLPPKLVKLIFGENFNQQITNLPPIKILLLGLSFNQTLDYLPSSIIYLELDAILLTNNSNIPSSIKYIIVENDNYANLAIINVKQNIPKNTKIVYNSNDQKYLTNKKIRL